MQRIGLTSLLTLALATSALPGLAAGAPPKPLKLTVKSIIPRARSQSPQTFEVELGCDSPELFQGRLELKFYLGKRLVHDFLSHDLAVTAGGQRFRIVLPPLVVRAEKTQLNVYGRFLMEKQAIDLGEEGQTVNVPATWRRSLVAAVVHPQELLHEKGMRGTPEALGLEQFNPFGAVTRNTQSDAQLDLVTNVPRLTPEELPAIAPGYASFDLLFIEAEGFVMLRPRQLAAIGDWTAAGGSLVVAPSGKMSAEHVDFLNRLAGSQTGGEAATRTKPVAYSLNEEGQLEIGERMSASGAKFTQLACGLGRALVIHERLDPEVDCGTSEWKGAVAFLWKVRAAQIEPILKNGVWNYPAQQRQNMYGAFRPYAPLREELPRNIRQLLMPERIEGVPLWVVVIILTLYLVVIAPGDYYLLGRLNCRRYTWVFFVLASALFTGCTVMIAERYMGHADYRTSLVFADLASCVDPNGPDSNDDESDGNASDDNGMLARATRFELLFSATQRQIEIPVRNALYVDMTDRSVLPEASLRDRRPFFFADDEEMDVTDEVSVDMPVYAGLMPNAFHIEQQMRQWSPRINRQTKIGHDPELLAETAIDWNALRPGEWKTPAGQKKLRDTVLAKEPAARVLLFHGTSCSDLVNDSLEHEHSMVGQPGFSALREPALVSLVHSASVRKERGLFSVVSQISPTGGEYLEDLALLDAGDSEQWLLAIIVRRDNNWFVFRRLYRGRHR